MDIPFFRSVDSLFPSTDSFPPTMKGTAIFMVSSIVVGIISGATLGKFISLTLGHTAHFVKERCYSTSCFRLSEDQKKTAARAAHLACLLLGLTAVTALASVISARATTFFQKFLVSSAYGGCLRYFTDLPKQKDGISSSFYYVFLEDRGDPEFFCPSEDTIKELEHKHQSSPSEQTWKNLAIAHKKKNCSNSFSLVEILTNMFLISRNPNIPLSAMSSTAFTLGRIAYAKYYWGVPEKSHSS